MIVNWILKPASPQLNNNYPLIKETHTKKLYVQKVANLVHQASRVLKLLYPLAGNARGPTGK
jgi:hypothetical protein